jgi:PQQ-dependent dehydrogenase (methanol/ethanol family)
MQFNKIVYTLSNIEIGTRPPNMHFRVFFYRLCISVLVLFACGFAPRAQNADAPTNPFHSDPGAIATGKILFDAACSPCHGAGATGGRAPALASARFSHGDEDGEIFANIQDGIPGTEMGEHKALSAQDTWRLVAYLRDVSGSGAQATAAKDATPESDAASIRGEAAFYGHGECASCHEISGRGSSAAADLSSVGKNGTQFIRERMHATRGNPAVLRYVQAKLPNGRPVQGVLRDEDSLSIHLLQPDSSVLMLDRRSLLGLQVTTKTLGDLDRRLSGEDIDDLIAFLSRQRQRAVDTAIAPRSSDGPSYSRLLNAAAEPKNWLTYWGTYDGRHFSELTQITPHNVGALQARWSAQMLGPSLLQATPIVADGIMYVSGPPGDVYALDAKSGLRIWKFSRKQDVTSPHQINASNRGVAVAAGRVFVGTLDNLLIAIDARTGRELWERRLADTLEGYTITAAPLAIPGRVIIGVAGGEFGLRGFLDAYDPGSGERLWRFYTIPAPGEPGSETWTSDSWQHGGAGTWLTGAFDSKSNVLYWTIGNPAPAFNPYVRPGDNFYSDSVVALDPQSGKLKWHYQFTPNDSHDWDAVQDLILTDRVIDGTRREVLLHADRNGFFYTLDRSNGAFISASPFVRQNWNDGFDPSGKPRTRPDSIASPHPTPVYPALGGTNFQAPSFDDKTGAIYIAFQDGPLSVVSGEARWERGSIYPGGRRVWNLGSSDDSAQGIKALDVATSKELWRFDLTRRSGAAGVLGTRGGVLFAASGEGTFLALDSRNGRPLWHFKTGGPISASPISYAVDGRQFVAIAAGNILYSFSLPTIGEP